MTFTAATSFKVRQGFVSPRDGFLRQGCFLGSAYKFSLPWETFRMMKEMS